MKKSLIITGILTTIVMITTVGLMFGVNEAINGLTDTVTHEEVKTDSEIAKTERTVDDPSDDNFGYVEPLGETATAEPDKSRIFFVLVVVESILLAVLIMVMVVTFLQFLKQK